MYRQQSAQLHRQRQLRHGRQLQKRLTFQKLQEELQRIQDEKQFVYIIIMLYSFNVLFILLFIIIFKKIEWHWKNKEKLMLLLDLLEEQ